MTPVRPPKTKLKIKPRTNKSGEAKRTRRPLLLEGFTKAVEVATAKPIFNAPVRDFQGIRVGRYKYVRYAGGVRELYDLRDDPAELHSRVHDPRYRAVRAFLARRLNRPLRGG